MHESNQHETVGWARLSWGGGLILLATVLVYLPLWKAGFIWDDDALVTDNPAVKASEGLRYIWLSTRLPDYFPLTLTSFWLEWRLWGMWAGGYHLTNVLLHGLSAVLLWRVLGRLKVGWGWWAGLVFAVHPVNVESVAWIAERKNTLAMVFYLLTVLCYLRHEQAGSAVGGLRSRQWYGLAVGCFLLALLSKTAVVMLPVVLLGCAWWQRGKVSWQDVRRTVLFFVLALVLGLVTVWFQSHRAIGGDPVHVEDFQARLAGAGWAVWFYLWKAVIPVNLSFVYPRWEINASSVLAYMPGLAWAGCLGLCWWYRKGWGRAPLLALGYYVVMLLPVLGFVDVYFQLYSLVADHWQYFSIIGIIGLGAGLLARGYARFVGVRRWGVVWVGVLVVGLLGWQSWRQAWIYRDNETLWRDTLVKNPACWLAHNNLGLNLVGTGKADEALTCYRAALQIKPDRPEIYNNLGSALLELGKTDEALQQFAEALRRDPNFAMACFNVADAFNRQGKRSDAIDYLRKAIQFNPTYAEAHNNLACLLVREGKPGEAISHFHEALRLKPDYVEARNNLANILTEQGKPAEAIGHLEHALQLRPDDAMARNNMGTALFRLGRLTEAVGQYEEALRLKPEYGEARYNLVIARYQLGEALSAQGKWEEAVLQYQRVVQLKPDNAQAYDGLGAALSQQRRYAEAVECYRKALGLAPETVTAQNNLAWVLATCGDASVRNGAQAVELAENANRVARGKDAGILDTLAAAYAEAGRFNDAVRTAEAAIGLANGAGQGDQASRITARRQLYQAGRPYHEGTISAPILK